MFVVLGGVGEAGRVEGGFIGVWRPSEMSSLDMDCWGNLRLWPHKIFV